MTAVRTGVATDVGRRRQNNQDSIVADERLFAVADGVGGYFGGEVASLTAIEALRAAFARNPTVEGLAAALDAAANAVLERSRSEPDLRQMGTTLSAVALVDADASDDAEAGEIFAIGHVGDSRIYLLRDGELTQLTDDHTVPEEMRRAGQLSDAEAAVDPRRHILTRSLGPNGVYEADLQTLIPYSGDRLMLCSDGLTDEVPERDIAKTLRTIADPGEAAARLVDLANQAGGADNISVVVVDVVDDDDRARRASATVEAEPPAARRTLMTADERNAQLRELARESDDDRAGAPWVDGPRTSRRADSEDEADLPTRRVTVRMVLFLLLLVLVVAGAVGAVGWYARGSYFVGLDEGHVTIFKGRPGGLFVFEPTVEERTRLTEAAVPEARIEDVEAGHEVATLEEARRYVANLERASAPASTTTTEPAAPTTAPPGAPTTSP